MTRKVIYKIKKVLDKSLIGRLVIHVYAWQIPAETVQSSERHNSLTRRLLGIRATYRWKDLQVYFSNMLDLIDFNKHIRCYSEE